MPRPPDMQGFDIYLAKMVRFTNFLSHDIRQPLETLVLVLEKALQQPWADRHAPLIESLADIRAMLTRIDELIEHYFSLARLVELYAESVELGAVVETFAVELRPQLVDRGITLRLENLTALGPVRLHMHTFLYVLIQLVDHAIDAMPQGGVLTFRGARQGSHVCLEVQDTGYGMPEDQLLMLFDPLCAIQPEGAALGLDTAQQILAAHRGVIILTSTPGRGTSRILMLPLAVVKGTDLTGKTLECTSMSESCAGT